MILLTPIILLTSIVSLINGIAAIILALLTWLHNPKAKVNRLLALMC
ncbi:unnamed protein product, partial [marine sediment metagenome]